MRECYCSRDLGKLAMVISLTTLSSNQKVNEYYLRRSAAHSGEKVHRGVGAPG